MIRRFTDQLDSSKFQVLYLSDSKLTPRHFYKGMLEQLGCEAKFYRGDAKRQLHREIELMRGVHGVHPVVIVDEAHYGIDCAFSRLQLSVSGLIFNVS